MFVQPKTLFCGLRRIKLTTFYILSVLLCPPAGTRMHPSVPPNLGAAGAGTLRTPGGSPRLGCPPVGGGLGDCLHHPQGPLPCVVRTHRGGALHAHVAWGRALYWGGLLEAPARQLHAHRQEDLQLLGRGPPNLGDEDIIICPQLGSEGWLGSGLHLWTG